MRSLLAGLALLIATPALSEVPTADRLAALEERTDEFLAVFETGEWGDFFNFIPPRVISALAQQHNVSEADVRAAMMDAMDTAMEGVNFTRAELDVAAATFLETPEGARTYGLIPTLVEFTIAGQGNLRATSHTLALDENGEWYLVRVAEPQQLVLLQAAYPEFEGVSFPQAFFEPIE